MLRRRHKCECVLDQEVYEVYTEVGGRDDYNKGGGIPASNLGQPALDHSMGRRTKDQRLQRAVQIRGEINNVKGSAVRAQV